MAHTKPQFDAPIRSILAAAWALPKLRAKIKAGMKKKYGIDIKTLQDLLNFLIDNMDEIQQIVEFIFSLISMFTK